MSCAFASLQLPQQTVSTGVRTESRFEDSLGRVRGLEPRTGQEIIEVGVRFRSTSAPLNRCAQSLEISSVRPYLNQL